MQVLHVADGVGQAGHVVHYAVLVVGLAGLVALLGPQLTPSGRGHEPRDDHERQVAALRASLAGFGEPGTTLTRPLEVLHIKPVPSRAVRLVLPLATVSSGAAALAHAVMTPEHLAERTLFGLFFAVTALLQLAWCAAVTRHATPRLLVLGAAGNAAVLALWATTRTVGLPFGLLSGPEAVGLFDAACLVWELVVVAASVGVLLRRRTPRVRLPGWPDWHPAAVVWLTASVAVLGGLTLIGHAS